MEKAMRPTWEELNAYADGELDAARAAEIAADAAEDRALAGEIAQLMKTKSTVSQAAGTPRASERLRARVAQTDRPGARRYRWAALAAGLALCLVAAGIVASRLHEGAQAPQWLEQARAVHQSFVPTSDGASLKALPATAFALEGKFVLLPDLGAGKLTLVGVEDLTKVSDLKGVAAHYRGTRGCRLTLVVLPEAPAAINSEALTPAMAGEEGALTWREGEGAYLLLGSGMDTARFQVLAEKIREATRELRLFTPEEETALAQSRANSAPCSA